MPDQPPDGLTLERKPGIYTDARVSSTSILPDGYGRGPMKAKTYAVDDHHRRFARSGFTPLEQTFMDSGEPDRTVAMRHEQG